jgi:hypothetical protein
MLLLVRFAAMAGMAVWFGGFTFYSAIVIPELHEQLGGLEAGAITGRVSNPLNAFGSAAVAAWWIMAACERGLGPRWARWGRTLLLATTTAILIGLVALHPVLDARLESGSMEGFYPLHQIYLIASSAQWGINLALIAVTLWIWQGPNRHLTPDPRSSLIPSPLAGEG